MKPLRDLADQLASGTIRSRDLVEECLDNIEAEAGEGGRAFLAVYRERALADAAWADRLRSQGNQYPQFLGIPVSIKDLFDEAGVVSRAGSRVLGDGAPAGRDAPVVASLRAAGFIIVGRTNMTEFAYSGLGLNPHYGTPLNPFDRETGRIPGGSSSGGAVSVTDSMAAAALGTDTGGSCRIPAALCGIVGFKPTASRVSTEGAVPLSPTLDSIGPLAGSVDCCRIMDGIISGEGSAAPVDREITGLRFVVPKSYVLEDLDDHVASSFERALSRLSAAGAMIGERSFDDFLDLPEVNALGGFAAAEAFAWHRSLLAERGGEYDPRVSVRIKKGRSQNAADYIDLLGRRDRFIRSVKRQMAPFDAMLLPTVPQIAPTL